MLRQASAVSFCVFLSCAGAAMADSSDCAMLLKQDIFNRTTVIDKATNQSRALSDLCSKDSGGSSDGLSISYDGFNLGGSSASQFAKSYCSNSFSESDIRSEKGIWQQMVDPGIISAVSQCLALNSRGLHAQINPHYDTHAFDITFRFDGDKGTRITDVIPDGNIQCSGDFYDEIKKQKPQGALLTTNTRGFKCEAKDNKPDARGDIGAGYLTVITDWDPIQARLPTRMAPSMEQRLKSTENAAAALMAGAVKDVTVNYYEVDIASGSGQVSKAVECKDGKGIAIAGGVQELQLPGRPTSVRVHSSYQSSENSWTVQASNEAGSERPPGRIRLSTICVVR